MKDGRTLWEALVAEYDAGVSDVVRMRKTWEQMAFFVDGERFEVVAKNLGIQEREAKWWRNAMLAYFQSKSGLAIPAGHPPLEHPLEYYESRQSP